MKITVALRELLSAPNSKTGRRLQDPKLFTGKPVGLGCREDICESIQEMFQLGIIPSGSSCVK